MSEGNLKIKVEGGIPNDICQINQDLLFPANYFGM